VTSMQGASSRSGGSSTSYRRRTAHPWEEPGTALHAWATSMKAAGLRVTTVAERPRVIARAADVMGVPADAMTVESIVTWLAGLEVDGEPVAPATRATYFATLHAWHKWLQQSGRRVDDPMITLRPPRVPRAIPRPVSTDVVARTIASTRNHSTRVMLRLAAFAGLRAAEIARVRGQDIDPWAATITVTGKGGLVRTIPLHPIVLEDARHMPRSSWWFPSPAGGGPIRADSVSAALGRAIRAAGFTGTGHQLRHWYGTQLVRGGADIRVVQELMRHESLASTARYVQVDDRQRRDALDMLPIIGEEQVRYPPTILGFIQHSRPGRGNGPHTSGQPPRENPHPPLYLRSSRSNA